MSRCAVDSRLDLVQRRHVQPAVRVLLTWLLVFAVTGVGFGPLAGPATDERFPCEHCLCGCASAAECWSDCCCHTPLERARWALVNGVAVPTWARQTLEAVNEIQATLDPTVDLATLPACCRSRLLGPTAQGANDHATCKQRPALSAGGTALLCLAPKSSELRYVAPLVGFVQPAIDRKLTLGDPEPSVPPPRA